MSAVLELPVVEKADEHLPAIVDWLLEGRLIPYLGPGLSAGASPDGYEALAAFFAAKVALPKRARGNPFASAQFIEARKHRKTLDALMAEAFAGPAEPGPLHAELARIPEIHLVVDTWYDDAMRRALAGRSDWGEVQGTDRTGFGEARWYTFYGPDGAETIAPPAHGWSTLLYKPHGGARPAGNFLIADSDYVEVLTEIDIQTPIPEMVKTRRSGRGFLFVGCRFDDQTLRIYARQIMKRSRGPHFALVDPATLTRNELRFFAVQGIAPVAADAAELAAALARTA
ncbi:SIR2 family protein [Afifella sp. IM 167]|uniref:SIR2 family NAD-dependent protein deacylase n=1 Tax=Afifella sp. IM 167 TaxID=2033586 RepID=UPI001CCF128B|nr:SIR2 family protein [Afifella sp. IM 167]MBZ8135258.1 SIR2 family protein [Afifella sp. IM 167]